MTLKTRHWLGAAFGIVVIDQVTKFLALQWLNYGDPVAVFPGLNFTLVYNTGAAFSLLSEASGWQRWLFAAVALIVSVVITFWLRQVGSKEWWLPIALTLILGGAIGNFWDRVSLGYVIDFIQVYYQQWSWPAFNIADSAICVGAVMLLLSGWIKRPAVTTEA
jgi:signal peptidase II